MSDRANVRRALLLALCFTPVLASASETDEDEEILVTAPPLQDDLQPSQRPGGIDMVAASEFSDRVAASLRDALAFSPGIYLQPRYGQEVRISIRGSGISRGFHLRGIMLFQDGMALNLADDSGDFQELDPRLVERFEIFRGGSAVHLGGATLGGAIDAITPTGLTTAGAAAAIEGGSFGTFRAMASLGMRARSGDAYAALAADRSLGDREHARSSSFRFTGNVGLRPAEKLETRFYVATNHAAQELPGQLTLSQALSFPAMSPPTVKAMNQQRDIKSLRLANKTRVELDGKQIDVAFFYSSKQLFHPIFQVIDQKGEDVGGQITTRVHGSVGRTRWELDLGAVIRSGMIDSKQYQNLGGTRGRLTARAENRAHTMNAFGELRLHLAPSLTAYLGGVLVHGARRIDNMSAPQRSGDARFTGFTPRMGVQFEPMATVQLFASVNRSIELPGYVDLNQVSNTGMSGFVPLSPQRAWTLEFGTRGTIAAASWNVTFYRSVIEGELVQYSTDPSTPAITFNADETSRRGVEASLDLRLAGWLAVKQSYQFSDFRFNGDERYGDNRMPVVPRHLWRGEMTFGTRALNVTPRIEWVPQGAWADYHNTMRAPGYSLLGLGAQIQLTEKSLLFVDARNLLDQTGIADVVATIRATPESAVFYPLERRAIFFGVRARY